MAARKRASSRPTTSSFVDRAVTAGRNALRQAEGRLPTDVRRNIERAVKDGQKTVMSAIDRLEAEVRRSAKQADVDKALKRLEGLTKQVQELARAAASRGSAGASTTRRRATSTTRRATTAAKRKTTTARRSTTARKVPMTKPAPRTSTGKSAPGGTASRRSAAPSTKVRSVPGRPAPGPVPEPVDSDGSSA